MKTSHLMQASSARIVVLGATVVFGTGAASAKDSDRSPAVVGPMQPEPSQDASAAAPVSASGGPAGSVGTVASSDVQGVATGTHQPAKLDARGAAPASADGARQASPAPSKTVFPWGLEFDVMPVLQRSKGFDLFGTDDVSTRVGLVVERDLFNVARKTPLSVELGWNMDTQTESELFPGFRAELLASSVYAGAAARHQLLSFLAPHVHLGLGESWLRATFTANGTAGSREFESKKWATFGFLGAGVTVTLPTQIPLQFGLLAEGGYLVSASMPLRLEPKTEAQQLASSGATLGSLDRSGPYLRFGVFARY
jgi:hypothetical protein